MIKRLTNDTVQANLYTIGPNLTAVVVQLVTCWLSDYTQQRAWFSIGPMLVSMLGFIFLGALDLVHRAKLGYFFTYWLTFGTFTPVLLVPTWVGANTPSASARAVALGLLSTFQNLGGIISSGVYRAQDAPTYRPALITVSVFQAAFIVVCFAMRVVYWRLNRQLAEGKVVRLHGVEVGSGYRFML